jgi:hypothetical protein
VSSESNRKAEGILCFHLRFLLVLRSIFFFTPSVIVVTLQFEPFFDSESEMNRFHLYLSLCICWIRHFFSFDLSSSLSYLRDRVKFVTICGGPALELRSGGFDDEGSMTNL